MEKAMIEVKGLEKSYKTHRALKGISFNVYPGEILGLIGPNGAGKSTAMHILSGMLKMDRGEVWFHGKSVQKDMKTFKKCIGIVPQDIAIYEDIRAIDNVKFFASLYGLRGATLEKAVQDALQFTGLLERQYDKPKTFSGGMKRRLNIACAIAHHPEVILMDEPTVGIDPQSRKHILDSIQQLRAKGTSVLYTTHYMEEIEEIATRIIIMDQGEIIASGAKDELKHVHGEETLYIIETHDMNDEIEELLYRIDGVKRVYFDDQKICVTSLKGIENLDQIISSIIKQDLKIKNISSAAQSLEMIFLKLTGRTLRD